MYLRRRQRAAQEGERRNIFLRYLGEVASAVSEINGADRDGLYTRLLEVAKKKTAEADARFDERGRRVAEEDEEEDYGDNVLIVDQQAEELVLTAPPPRTRSENCFERA